VGALSFAAVVVAHALATNLAVLVGLRLLLGVAEALFFVAGFAALADLAPPNRAGEALSFNSLALYLGIAFGPTVGRVLLDAGGFTLVWVGAGLLALTAAVLATRLPETAPLGSDTEPTPLIHRGVLAPALALFTGVAGAAGFFAFVTLRAEELGSDDWSVVLLAYGLVVVVCRIVFARLPDRVPAFWLGAAALGLCAVGLLVASVAPGFAGLFAGAVILALGVAFATPAFFAAIFARVERSENGAAAGTASVMLDLAFAGGPVVAGIVTGMAGIPAAFAVLAAIAVAGAIGTVVLALSAKPRVQAA
jgi:predicted MFS family arabinose efflux permease